MDVHLLNMHSLTTSYGPDFRNICRKGLTKVSACLVDSVLGLFALLAAELALAPILFDLSPKTGRILDTLQWFVIALFAAEYASSLALSSDRPRFVRDPWRLLDLFIIVVPIVSLLPAVSTMLRSTPILRLLRLVRLASFAARMGGSVVRDRLSERSVGAGAPPEIHLLNLQLSTGPQTATWNDFVSWAAKPAGVWCHLSNVTPAHFDSMIRVEGVSRSLLESFLSQANYPRLESSRGALVLSLWLPNLRTTNPIRLDRSAVLLVASPAALLTVASQSDELPTVLVDLLRNDNLAAVPLSMRLLLALLKLVLDRHDEIAGHLERQLRNLEDVPVHDSQPSFFEESFRLRKELSAAKSDLWRVKGILANLAEKRVALPTDTTTEVVEILHALCDRADYLYQTADNLREGLLSVLELHLNVVSFEMNKVMRLLAVVSVLGLIPAVIGGLLGMNCIGNPWPVTLSEVTFAVASAVLLALYLFLVRGWLR